MTDEMITQLDEATSFAATDIIPIVVDVAGTPITKYIKAEKGFVTNGDTHNHLGGDGGAIAYSSLTGTLTQDAGTYTPTLTNTTNISASVLNGTFQYIRLGSIVTVAGSVQIDPTATGSVVLKMTIPVASNFTTNYQANGNATNPGATAQFGSIISETDDTVSLNFTATTASNAYWRIMFTYVIV